MNLSIATMSLSQYKNIILAAKDNEDMRPSFIIIGIPTSWNVVFIVKHGPVFKSTISVSTDLIMASVPGIQPGTNWHQLSAGTVPM